MRLRQVVTLFSWIFYTKYFTSVVTSAENVAATVDNLNGKATIPPGLKICSRYSDELNKCIKDSINNLIPTLKDERNILGVRSVDPYIVDIIKFRYDRGGVVSVSMDIKNASTYGMSGTKVRNVRSKVTDKDLQLDISVWHPHITLESSYQGEGKFNDFNVKSGGYVNVTMSDIKGVWKLRGAVETINGTNYMKINSFNVVPKINHMKFFATGLFPDPDLTQFAVEFLNQNWKFLVEQFFPISKRAWEPIVLEIANGIFGMIPYDDILPK